MRIKTLFFPLAATFLGTESLAQQTEHPNILWLTFEDTSPQFIGCYGNETARTPVMDKLAGEGVRFTNAYSTGTVSSPSRFCLITGCRPGRYGTGNHRSAYEIPEFVHGFPEFLKQAGYYTSNNSKTDYNHKKHKEMIAASWNESSNTAGWRGRKPGQPFFAVFNSNHSHQSRTMTNPWELYEKQVLDKLERDRVLPTDAPFEIPPFYNGSLEMRKQVSRIYNSISLTDQHFGEILAELEKDGLRDSTIIFVFSDHGEGMPRGKGSALGTGYRVPFILWVPEKYKHLSPWGSGVITDELVSFEDFGATVLSLAGVDIPSYVEGTPFLPGERKDKKKYVFGACDAIDSNMELSRSVMDGRYVYTKVFTPYQPFVRWISYYDHGDIQKCMRKEYAAGVLNSVQREIMEPRVSEYLYDLVTDKWETNNLAGHPDYQKKLKELRSVLKRHLIETRDVNFLPEYTLSMQQPETIPYYLRLDEAVYPVEDVIETAMLSGLGAEVIEKQISKVGSCNPIVAYWAAVGLFTQRANLAPYVGELERILSTVSYSPARIWLAAAILNVEKNSLAYRIVREGILSPNNNVAICALNALVEMNIVQAKSFIPQLRKAEAAWGENQGRPGVESMMLVARLRLEGKDFRFGSFW
ncbi:sulfatase family protein [Bacteroides cellulosilyticus]|uniref:sulfatase family protein n=1 Tax=Bacteroides cellulosilyticus TaxID=246787 RepID=UPI0018A8BA85|nr:sulfatase [Bacteroides cellulosilyticus]